jgi:hypothetical protein
VLFEKSNKMQQLLEYTNNPTTDTAARVVDDGSNATAQLQQQSLHPQHDRTNSFRSVMDRRNSGFFMDDLFGGDNNRRRASLGFDMDIFNRRDSMDSTTQALDQAIFDLTRRRYSIIGGGAGLVGAGDSQYSAPVNYSSTAGAPFGMMPLPLDGVAAGGANDPNSTTATSLAARQQLLQQQQRDLEQRQRELERQRQQLIANMAENRINTSAVMPSDFSFLSNTSLGALPMQSIQEQLQQNQNLRNSLGLGSIHNYGNMGQMSSNLRQSLGLGGSLFSNLNADNTSTNTVNAAMQAAVRRASGFRASLGETSARSSAAQGANQWFICQVCSAKAFSSQGEAMEHEEICRQTNVLTAAQMSQHQQQEYTARLMNNKFAIHHLDGTTPAQRNFSLGMGGTSAHSNYNSYDPYTNNTAAGVAVGRAVHEAHTAFVSTGPFAQMDPTPLAMPSDKDWLTPLHCFVRRHCVQVFTATKHDVATPSKGKRKAIAIGQVGIRCPHCHSTPEEKGRERGSVYYPTTIASIYNAAMNLLQRHLHSCTAVPDEIMRRYETLKSDDARSGTSKRYWIESALALGLVDTADGIRYSAINHPPLPSLTNSQKTELENRGTSDFYSSNSNAMTTIHKQQENLRQVGNPNHSMVTAGEFMTTPLMEQLHQQQLEQAQHVQNSNSSSDEHMTHIPAHDAVCKSEQEMAQSAPLVVHDDQPYSTRFSYHLLSQMQPCVFTEADRLGKRKGLPPGFPGLACRHCFGGYGSGRFFPSSIKTLSDTSKTLNVLHNHMMRCRKCPTEVRENLEKLRVSHDA